jgi:hypothetical protein
MYSLYSLGFELSSSCMSMACCKVPWIFLHHLGLYVTKMDFEICCRSARD